MKLSEFLSVTKREVTDSEEYQWKCFGNKVRSFTFWNELPSGEGFDITCVYDYKQRVYLIEVWDHAEHIHHCWIDREYQNAYFQEAKNRGLIGIGRSDFTTVYLTEGGILDVCSVQFNQDEISESQNNIEVDLPEDLLLQSMLEAHKQDITFNDFVKQAITAMMEKHDG